MYRYVLYIHVCVCDVSVFGAPLDAEHVSKYTVRGNIKVRG